MAGIRVNITDAPGNTTHRAELPGDIPMRRLMPALIARLNLSRLGVDGQPVSYRLYHNGNEIGQDVDLVQAGVVDGSTITISQEATAGKGSSLIPGAYGSLRVWPVPPPVQLRRNPGRPRMIRLTAKAFKDIMTHCLEEPNEVGGLLLGSVVVERKSLRITVLRCIRAKETLAGPAHLTFTHRTWELLRIQQASCKPGILTVGWYHSHPGFGLFLSAMDCDLHLRIFAYQPWCVALVCDPTSGKMACFWPSENGYQTCPHEVMDQPPSKRKKL